MSRHDALLLDSPRSGAPEPFAIGASRYLDAHPGLRDPQPRIYVKFRPEGVDANLSFLALLDTGGHFCILSQDVADLIHDRLTERLRQVRLRTARGLIEGDLYRHKISLIADRGKSLALDTNVLIVPDWTAPCFIGYSGVLEYLCFAVDSRSNQFYFGY